ncbi:MAG: hypothetical protein JSU69_02745 [Candidatus Zixiibacteriota bacterium]|nr:MAG: hypothetical protein JSU69_02745 [candidate division Zixibacteria bacterium]
MKHSVIGISLLALALTVSGCTLASRTKIRERPAETEAVLTEGKGDAYLFDVKIRRNEKKNSVRLDVYRSGDSLSLYARGYLGKGVLKGLITYDSLVVYFPTEHQYYSGRLVDVLEKSCAEAFAFERTIIDLFIRRPVELDYSLSSFYLTILKDKNNEQRYRLVGKSCPETIDLTYRWREKRYILDEIEYSSSDGSFKFSAARRRHRLNVEIPGEKFILAIPDDAARIHP